MASHKNSQAGGKSTGGGKKTWSAWAWMDPRQDDMCRLSHNPSTFMLVRVVGIKSWHSCTRERQAVSDRAVQAVHVGQLANLLLGGTLSSQAGNRNRMRHGNGGLESFQVGAMELVCLSLSLSGRAIRLLPGGLLKRPDKSLSNNLALRY